jgi:hypothetical protein
VRKTPGRWAAIAVAAFVGVMALIALLGLVVMLLWNSLVPVLFHGPALEYWQALGLLILSRLLFGGLRGRGWHGHWRQRMWRERWERLTPEERAQLREKFASRCWGRHDAGESASPPQSPVT